MMRHRVIFLPVVGVFITAIGSILSAHTAGLAVPPSFAGEVSVQVSVPTPPLVQRQPFGGSITSQQSSQEFSDKLKVIGSNDQVTYVMTTSSSSLAVSSDGVITIVGKSLGTGAYTVSGTDSNKSQATGTWTYTLTVTAGSGDNHHHGDS